MLDNKNLIEIVKVGGIDVAIERVNGRLRICLTDLAKASRTGKRVKEWLELKATQSYLEVARKMLNRGKNSSLALDESKLGIPSLVEPIVVKRGGAKGNQGTWCNDFRIANRFVQWLSPEYAWEVDGVIEQLIRGEFILDEEGYIPTEDGRQWVSREIYCSKLGRSTHSFSGLKAHYPHHFEFVNNQHVMSREFFIYQSKKDNFEEERISFKLPVEDKRQLALPFAEYEEIMEG